MVRAIAVITSVALLILSLSVAAAEHGSKDEAVAMVKRVQAMYAQDGLEATLKAVSDKSVGEFHDRDLYPFIYDMNGTCIAHGARPALIGKNLIDIKDQDGKYLIQEIIKSPTDLVPAGSTTNGRVRSTTRSKSDEYIEKMGPTFVGVGV